MNTISIVPKNTGIQIFYTENDTQTPAEQALLLQQKSIDNLYPNLGMKIPGLDISFVF